MTRFRALTVLAMLPALAACSGHAVDLDRDPNGVSGAGAAGSEAGELLVPNERAADLIVDEQRLYWLSELGFRSCSKRDCASDIITYASRPSDGGWNSATVERSIGASGGSVFWQATSPEFTVMSCAVTGCVGEPTRVFVDKQHAGYGFWTDAGYVYWESAFDIYRCPADGCRSLPEVVAARSSANGPIVFEGDEALWLYEYGAIMSAAKDGSSSPKTLVAALPIDMGTSAARYALAVDANNLYWVDGAYHVQRCPRHGCGSEAPTLVVATDTEKFGLYVDARNVYWLDGRESHAAVHYCPLTGCSESTAATPEGVFDFAFDDTSIYWSDSTLTASSHILLPKNIHRIAKPQ